MSTYYLLPNEHLDTLKAMMHKPTEQDLWYWKEGAGDEDQMEAILNKAVATQSEQDLHVKTLIIPKGMFVLGVGVGWKEGDKIISKNSDLYPTHFSQHNVVTTMLCLRRDFAKLILPKETEPAVLVGVGFSLDNFDGYYAFRFNGLYE